MPHPAKPGTGQLQFQLALVSWDILEVQRVATEKSAIAQVAELASSVMSRYLVGIAPVFVPRLIPF
jgi:hypothetical protein